MKRLAVLEVPKDFTEFSDFKNFKVEVEEVSVPVPGPGEVLVKMVAAAVNPSDEGDLKLACKGRPEGIKLPRVSKILQHTLLHTRCSGVKGRVWWWGRAAASWRPGSWGRRLGCAGWTQALGR